MPRVPFGPCVFLALLLAGSAATCSAKQPNILFIFSDDHATQAIGAYGSKVNKTPNLDRIAKEGAVFHNSFCANSICGPSRACILTGKHSHLNGSGIIDKRMNHQQLCELHMRLVY